MSTSSTISASVTNTAAAATSSAAEKTLHAGSNLKVVGIILAIASGILIGSSFVFKKKGLLRSQANGVAGEGVAYLKSPLWWTGMIMMILGELCNFAAYAFVEAIVVTPLGALSVVICAILSSIFLKETLTFFGWLGCGLCILGSVIIALNGPSEGTVGQIKDFQKLFLAPGFLAYAGVLIAASVVIVLYFAPRYGKKSMLWYIMVCSMIGGISVSVTTGLGSAIVTTAYGDNQFKYWFMYFLLVFVIVTLLTEVYYLNVALALFNTAMVTPTYYVIFTFFSIITTIVLFQGLKASPKEIITLVMGFLVICFGIVILQMSKVDPSQLKSITALDRRSTILLQAARSKTENMERGEEGDGEKSVLGVEDPGMDALRGSFGAVGSIIRARSVRRMSQSSSQHRASRATGMGLHHNSSLYDPHSLPTFTQHGTDSHFDGLKRHQLYDAPVPPRSPFNQPHPLSPSSADVNSTSSIAGTPVMGKKPTIKFGEEDVVHQYDRPGTGDRTTEYRRAVGGSPLHALGAGNRSDSGGGAGAGVAGLGAGGGYPPVPQSQLGLSGAATPRARMDGLPLVTGVGGGEWGGLGLDDGSSTLSSGRDSDVPNVTVEGPTRSSAGNDSNSSGSTTRPQGGPSLLSDSPESSRQNSDDSQQTLSIPAGRFRNDNEIRSAPPTLSPSTSQQGGVTSNPFARTTQGRLQARNIFSPSGSGPGGSFLGTEGGGDSALLSFPSVTDSARSDIMWDEDDFLASSSSVGGPTGRGQQPHGASPLNPAVHGHGHSRTESLPEPQHPRSRTHSNDSRGRGGKKHYPKGPGGDDQEESQSLWRRSQDSMSSTDGGEAESPLSPSLGGGIRLVTPPPRGSSNSADRF